MFEWILVGICLLLTGIAAVVSVYSYKLNKREMGILLSYDITSKVFSSKLCNTDVSIECAVKNLKNYSSFEELVGKEVFD